MSIRNTAQRVLVAASLLVAMAVPLGIASGSPARAATTPRPSAALAVANGLAQRPYLGWSSWSLESTKYPGYDGMNWITSANVRRMSDALAATLQPYGYVYVNVDSGWSNGFDGNGRPTADGGKFPEGIAALANYVHAKGQKLGVYYIGGLSGTVYDNNSPIVGTSCHARDIAFQPLTPTNSWRFNWAINWSNPCAQAYINSIADQFASWGVDFLKLDGITPTYYNNIGASATDNRGDVAAWSQALMRTGRPIWFTISWSVHHDYVNYWKQYANGMRIDTDVECYCGTLVTWDSSVKARFADLPQWLGDIGSGSWADLDAVDIGVGAMDGLSNDERQTVMTLWASESAPLYSGDDLTKLDSYGMSLLTNTEVLAVDQAARPARPVSTSVQQQVWWTQNADGSYTVALYNLGSGAATVRANWSDLGFSGLGSVRDLWNHSELGSFTGSFAATVPSHGSRLLRVTPGQVTAAALVNAASARCLDDPGANLANGTGLIVWDCNGAANQQWTATAAQLLTVLGRCLQARGNQTTAGTAVEIWDCNGAAGQQWRVNSDGTITGTQSGLCLDASGTANNTPVRLWTCTGAATQGWARR